jgi:hypothetical protein
MLAIGVPHPVKARASKSARGDFLTMLAPVGLAQTAAGVYSVML